MSNINQRLKLFMTQQKIQQNELAEESGITPSAVNQYLSNKISIGAKAQISICEAYQSLNANWLLFGRGKMYNDLIAADISEREEKKESEYLIKLANEKDQIIELLKQRLNDQEKLIKLMEGKNDGR